ncbi:MAG TPA: DNA polymerase, partial [Actinomycetales bacterium]
MQPAHADALVEALTGAGVRRGDPVALAVRPGTGLGLAASDLTLALPGADAGWVGAVEDALRPRWVWWSAATAATPLVAAGVRPATCWDLAAVHRLLAGGSDGSPASVWAVLHGLDPATAPRTGQLDLLTPPDEHAAGDPEQPVGPDGHLRAEWADDGWARTPDRLARWAHLALQAHDLQLATLRDAPGRVLMTARAESTAELLCVELTLDGLPLDVGVAEQVLGSLVGPRPVDEAHEARLRHEREQPVRRLVPQTSSHDRIDLRSPAHVRQALASVGIDVPDTRSWRLEPWRAHHPLVEELLTWRKADRLSTTYGYVWLDTQVGGDGRLRGVWSGSDGAAGRMTASAGLHNLPADLRPAVLARPGHVLVRADLGQIEPRVLAAVSGDPALTAATADDDLYQPVA